MITFIEAKTLKNEHTVVLGLFSDKENEKLLKMNKIAQGAFTDIIEKKKTSEACNITSIYGLGLSKAKRIILVGLGSEKNVDAKSLKKAIVALIPSLEDQVEVCIDSFVVNQLKASEIAQLFSETIRYETYQFDQFKTKKSDKNIEITMISDEPLSQGLNRGLIIADSVKLTRDLVNTPNNHLNTYELCDVAKDLVARLNNKHVLLKILDDQEIAALGMNAFLSVNRGSAQKARLIRIDYQGQDSFVNPLGLIGKGVMFDTGGVNLKVGDSIRNMKFDMAGAATVLGVFEAAVRLKLKKNIMLIIAATDNRIGPDSYVTDDIVTAMNGKTIEVVNTDAEGRLTLADALCYAQKEGARHLIDVATLTGAVVIALGDKVTGLFGNKEASIKAFLESSRLANEEFWQLPITDEIAEQVRTCDVADLKNSTGRAMGASGAAAFLREFVDADADWLHLDIAGTGSHKNMGTGVAVKSILSYLER